MEDNIPFGGKYPYNVGNRVILKIDNYYIVMGHLEKDSITVKVGDDVKPGQRLAIIGNSGLTPRPHLHMQVSKCEDGQYWKGKSVPILFNGLYYPIKNKIIKV
nr:M23 family metallopeptidase [Clostridium estertheticum]